MTTDKYIDENRTNTFRKNDRVIMVNCGEASFHKGRVWVCQTDSFKYGSGSEVVFLRGFSGSFSVRYLEKVGTNEK